LEIAHIKNLRLNYRIYLFAFCIFYPIFKCRESYKLKETPLHCSPKIKIVCLYVSCNPPPTVHYIIRLTRRLVSIRRQRLALRRVRHSRLPRPSWPCSGASQIVTQSPNTFALAHSQKCITTDKRWRLTATRTIFIRKSRHQ
jgi:hypothetical protein